MDNQRADKLIRLLEQLVTAMQPEKTPTLEQAVEAQVKNMYLERGIAEVFDKLNERDSVRNLINRKTAEVAAKTLDAIERTVGDAEYKSQRQRETEQAVKQALEEQKAMEKTKE